MGRNNEWESGAEGLWLAVVVQALEDLRGPHSPTGSLRGRLSVYSAKEWFQSPEGGIGSFDWICNALGLEVERVRRLALGSSTTVSVVAKDRETLGLTGAIEGWENAPGIEYL